MTKSQVTAKGFASKFSVYAFNPQVIPTGIATLVTMGTGVNYDILGEFNVTTYLFTPLEAGYYSFLASLGIQALNANDYAEIRILRNAIAIAVNYQMRLIVGNEMAQTLATTYLLPTDTVGVYVVHNFGANRNLLNGILYCRFDGHRIG